MPELAELNRFWIRVRLHRPSTTAIAALRRSSSTASYRRLPGTVPRGRGRIDRPDFRRSAVQHRLRLRRLRRPPRRRGRTSTGRMAWGREVVRVLKPDRHVLAGDRRRVRRRAEGHVPPRAGPVAAELGDLVLHVRRQLHEEVQPQPRPPVLLREGPQTFHLQRRGDPRALGAAAGLRRRAGQPQGPAAGRHLDPPPAGRARRLRARRATPGTSRGSAARSRSAPAGTAARCPSSSWAGSSAPARTPATSCSTRSAAAARRWPSPRSSTGGSSASSSRPTTPRRSRPGSTPRTPASRSTAAPSRPPGARDAGSRAKSR